MWIYSIYMLYDVCCTCQTRACIFLKPQSQLSATEPHRYIVCIHVFVTCTTNTAACKRNEYTKCCELRYGVFDDQHQRKKSVLLNFMSRIIEALVCLAEQCTISTIQWVKCSFIWMCWAELLLNLSLPLLRYLLLLLFSRCIFAFVYIYWEREKIEVCVKRFY